MRGSYVAMLVLAASAAAPVLSAPVIRGENTEHFKRFAGKLSGREEPAFNDFGEGVPGDRPPGFGLRMSKRYDDKLLGRPGKAIFARDDLSAEARDLSERDGGLVDDI
ncbi:hypothetical protein BJY52DRAFT_1216045 [Lactarius psammicola]|nr:hypothetical protein BJY52DRAFT_1216045 [Lactarius psammicola]